MLTDLAVRQAKPIPGRIIKLSDNQGLYLEVAASGSKLWRYRYRLAGKESVFAIGRFPDIGLGEARERRDAARALVKEGKNPATERRAERQEQIISNAGTFKSVGEDWREMKRSSWTDGRIDQVERVLKNDVYPQIGSLPIGSVKPTHVRILLKKIEQRSKTIAAVARQLCYSIFNFGIIHGLCEINAAASLHGLISRDTVKHAVALNKTDLAALLKDIGGYGSPVIRIALLLLAHCFPRTAELRKAEWAHIDWQASEWRIPAVNMKMRQPHIIPLTRQTVELLLELQSLTGTGKYLFPNTRDASQPISATTLNRALEYLKWGGKFSCHGFRATASTFLNEGLHNGSNGQPVAFRPDVIERQLAHAERSAVRGAYNHAQYMAERRVMMNTWSDFLDSLTNDGNVIAISGRARTKKA